MVLGYVSGLYGVKGWVKIHSYTAPREAILDYEGWRLERDGHWTPAAVAEGKPHGKTIIARFEGIDDRDEAASFVGSQIGVERAEMPATEIDQYYWSDLEGLTVEDENGDEIGKVEYLLETGANDVMVVDKAGQEVLIPFVPGEVIKDVDLDSGRIRVDWEWD